MADLQSSLPVIPIENKKPILSLIEGPLVDWLALHGESPFRAKQIVAWIMQKRAQSFSQMTDLPATLRERLEKEFLPFASTLDCHKVAHDDTQKLLLRLEDGNRVECVLMKEETRRSVCVSTQVGCAMGCVFCASGIDGVVRNLKSHEILEQLILARNLLPGNERLTHVVVMGMGEPMVNLDSLLPALDWVSSPKGLGIGARNITISTVGIPLQIRKFADLKKQYHLAVSLHAPNEELRSRIVPINARVGIDEVLSAADYFFNTTGRQVTFEYILLGEINDQPQQARELALVLRGRKAHVNLIPFNRVSGLPFQRPEQFSVEEFARILKESGQSVTIRKRKGADIDAACGQLRRNQLQAAVQ